MNGNLEKKFDASRPDGRSPNANPEADTGADTEAILQTALRAPSAENTQPWRVERGRTGVLVRYDRSRRMPSDPGGMLDYTGLGALIESIVLAASGRGLLATVEAPPPRDDDDRLPLVADIRFAPGGAPDPLCEFLASRCTTRRMAADKPVPGDLLESMARAVRQPGVRIDWIPAGRVRDVAALVGDATRLRFEHAEYHREFYENLRFTRDEAERTGDGLDVATLQLPPGVASVMRFFRKWSRTRVGNLLGYSRGIGSHAAKEVAGSGAVGMLTVEEPDPGSFLRGGRDFQRVWLEATRLGLAFHPVAGLTVFVGHGERPDAIESPPDLIEKTRQIAGRFRSLAPAASGRTPQMMFRVGYGPRPAVASLRRPIG
ncbi:hypothetical protein [Botrimarina sp.]|uniref:hypothetical protein n=1 Tax=Botrimarina sp. TaxID=2795802 RepID=UPI0032EDA918